MRHGLLMLVLTPALYLVPVRSVTSDNATCIPSLDNLPDPLSPGSSIQQHGNYVLPQPGMTILGDTCMVFCGETSNTEDSSLATPNPALHPLFSTTFPNIPTRFTVSIGTSTNKPSSTKPRSIEKLTASATKVVNPSYTKWIVGGDKQSTKWVVGGAHPTTLPPGASPTFAVHKRQESADPSPPKLTVIPNDAVNLPAGDCITMCPNAQLSGTPLSPTPSDTVVESGGGKRHLPPAFIALAIVLPLLATMAALAAGIMVLKYRRTIKVLRNERNRNLEMHPEGFFRVQR